MSYIKSFLFTFIILFLFSCNHEEKKTSIKSNIDSAAIVFFHHAPVFEMTTEMEVSPCYDFPLSFHLDSLFTEDTAHSISATYFFPVSDDPKFKKLNELSMNLIRKKENEFTSEDPIFPNGYTISEVWISDFSIIGNLVSMDFTGQSFTYGAAHYYHYYSSLNYDSKREKAICLYDIFALQTKKERQEFCDSINGGPYDSDSFRGQVFGYGSILSSENITRKTDFTISDESLTFEFDDYEMAPNLADLSVPLKTLKKFIKKDYLWLLDK